METDYERFKIKAFTHWELYLHEDQLSYLGRCYLWAHRNGKIDKTEMADEERVELVGLEKNIKRVLDDLWKPDLINWAFLQNFESHGHHLHEHIVPRYQTARIFAEHCFIDQRWGRNWAPAPKMAPIPDHALQGILIQLRASFN